MGGLQSSTAPAALVPREQMPQVDEIDIPELILFLLGKNIKVEWHVVPPGDLHARQRIDYDMSRAIDADLLRKPCLCSIDWTIIDGNHRWARHAIDNSNVPVILILLTFQEAVEVLFQFPKAYAYGDGRFHPIKN